MTTKQKLVAGAAGAGILLLGALWYFTSRGGGDEEEPPIIVENGSVVVGPTYPASDGNWGKWERQGSSPEWHYTNDTGKAGGKSSLTWVFNGQCQGSNTNPGWRKGPLRITYTDGTNSHTFVLLVSGGVTTLRTPPSEPLPTHDPTNTPWLLTFTGSVRLQRLEPQSGSSTDYCTFDEGSRPTIFFQRSD